MVNYVRNYKPTVGWRTEVLKKILMIICLSAVLVLTSCNRGERIAVYSADYRGLTGLKEGEFDSDAAKTWYLNQNPYRDFSCHVSEKNGKLFISNRPGNEGIYSFKGDLGYFIGVDFGVYDGWVRYYPYNSGESGDSPVLVIGENCKGMIAADNRRGYLLTRNLFGDEDAGGSLYELVLDDGSGEWKWNLIAKTDDAPVCFTYSDDDDTVYIITYASVVSVTIKSGSAAVLKTTDNTAKNAANSMVKIGNSLFCGTAMGVYEFRLDSGEEHWYPMDYGKYVR